MLTYQLVLKIWEDVLIELELFISLHPQEIKDIILVSNREQRVTVGDVVDVDFGYATPSTVACS